MNKLYLYIRFILKYSPLGLGAIHSKAQKWYSPTQKEVSTGAYISTSGQNPFWLRSNQYGIVPLESQFVTFRGGIYKEYKPQNAVSLSLSKSKGDNDMSLRQAETRQAQTDNNAVPLSLSKGKGGNDMSLRQAETRQFQTDISDNGLRQAQTDNDAVSLSLSKGKGDNDMSLRQAQTDISGNDNSLRQAQTDISGNDNGLRQVGTRQAQTDNNAVPLSLSKGNKFDYGYGFSAVANVGKVNQILLPEAYIKARYGAFEFYGGRRKEIVGLVDTTLTSGSYIWSGNALPMPKLQISIPNYTSIIGKGLVSIKGAYAHGWFDNGNVKNFYLHQKWLYGKVGKENWKVNFYGGFNHQVQWGGKPVTPYTETSTGRLITHYPTGWKTYIQVATGISLNRNGDGLEQEGVPLNEAWNRAGNHLGTVDIGAEIKLKASRLLLYRQSIYEDGSLYYLNNIADGLLGISYKRTNQLLTNFTITSIGIEYLNTTSQGGSSGSHNTIPELRGQDNYFNNGIYVNGWTYEGYILGTPHLIPLNTLNPTLLSKKYTTSTPTSYIASNRIKSTSMAINSHVSIFSLATKISFSTYYGNYSNPMVKTIHALHGIQCIYFPYKTILHSIQLAIDTSNLFGKPQVGIHYGLRKSW